MHVSLSSTAEEIIKRQVDLGLGNPEEIVDQALRLLESEQQRKLGQLRTALEEGEQSGAPQPYELSQLVAEADAEYKAGN